MVFITYSLAYFDRVNYGFGAAGGLARDLQLTPRDSSLLSSVFFLGYLLFQVPGTAYAERKSVKTLIFGCTFVWGILASLTGIVGHLLPLLVIRFLLGVAEAAVMPALLVYLSHWFTRSERSRANTFLILGNPITVIWMSVVSGYLIRSLGWRWMFILEGLPALVWSVLWLMWADEKPAAARWLAPQEQQRIQTALELEQAELRPIRNYRAALMSPRVLVLGLQYFCWSVGIYGFVLWLPSILKQASSFGMVGTGWLSALPFLLAAPSMLVASWLSDRSGNRKRFVWPCLLVSGLALCGSCALGGGHFWSSYALLIVAAMGLYAPYGPFFAIVPELLPRNVAGGATALINSFGALGGFCGSYLVGYLNVLTGNPNASYLLMGGSLLAAATLVVLLPAPRATAAQRQNDRGAGKVTDEQYGR